MKKVIFLMLTTLAIIVSSCDTPQVKDKQTVSKSKTVLKTAFGEEIQEVEFKGHVYLIFAGVNKGNIIHHICARIPHPLGGGGIALFLFFINY